MGSQRNQRTWEDPYLNSLSGTGPGTPTDRYWNFGETPLLVQKAANAVSSPFISRFAIQLPFAEFLLQDCVEEQQTDSALQLLGNSQLTGAAVQQDDTPVDFSQAQSDEYTGFDASQSAVGQAHFSIFVGTVIAIEAPTFVPDLVLTLPSWTNGLRDNIPV